MYIQDFDAEVIYAKSKSSSSEISLDDFKRITEVIASGDVQYSYPYQMKEFMIKYAQLVKLVLDKESK
jgi:hypothetical protein